MVRKPILITITAGVYVTINNFNNAVNPMCEGSRWKSVQWICKFWKRPVRGSCRESVPYAVRSSTFVSMWNVGNE
jgi:hypothetical protein